ncbi:GNAT family N-acetyltransferase [Streptomyces sp. NPDC058525]|uniref:GNAT family N-acetyltransferase n=1 Tax=Streptomyces sp. NPDC058525 TaxID=3346538 RepID=UPI00364F962F
MSDHLSPASPTTVRLTRYTKTEQSEILGAGEDPFGVAHTGLTWLPKEDHFGVRLGDRLVAHAGLLRLPVTIGDRETEAMGVGGVAVSPHLRGQGLARLVITAALAHARTLGPRHALLFCRAPLVPFYEGLGWQPLDQEVHVEQHEGPVLMPLRTMWTPLHDAANRPTGAVRVHSFPM